jgi:hypothetical protein
MERILSFGESNICLFCGEPEKRQIGHDYETWYECDCPDAVKDREIREQIRTLESQLPSHKFEIIERPVLREKR